MKMKNTFHYYNCNPQHRLTDDCVVRAICSSTGESWENTLRALTEWSIKTGYMLNTPECYGKYLESIGYVKQKQPLHKDGSKVRLSEFCKTFAGHAICHCGRGHITYVANNSVWDIWNTENEIVGVYWVQLAEQKNNKNMKRL